MEFQNFVPMEPPMTTVIFGDPKGANVFEGSLEAFNHTYSILAILSGRGRGDPIRFYQIKGAAEVLCPRTGYSVI